MSLKDLMKNFWNDPYKARTSMEAYHPIKIFEHIIAAIKLLQFLHSKGIYYGDMKPDNLLIFRNQNVKANDFGISFKIEKGKKYTLKGYTPGYGLSSLTEEYTYDQLI